MTFNIIDTLQNAFNSLGDLISQFTYFKSYLEGVITDVNNFNFITFITPYLGTIKYVIGAPIYNMTIGIVQVSLFIGLTKAFFQIVHIVLNSGLIKKPLAIVKNLLNL